jgi:5-hydroxyisourate hydrolase
MSAITTHVLDTARGCPAHGVEVSLWFETSLHQWKRFGHGQTDADGRLRTLLSPTSPLSVGNYRLVFATGAFFAALGVATFYPEVTVTFSVHDTEQHFHVPLLLSPFGYSTYRGS